MARQLNYIESKGGRYVINHPDYKEEKSRWWRNVENDPKVVQDVEDLMTGDILSKNFLIRMAYIDGGREEEVNRLMQLTERQAAAMPAATNEDETEED